MTHPSPEYLYRYCSAQRAIQVLSESRLFLCPPKDLNDLYEGSLGRLTHYDAKAARALQARIVSIHRRVSIETAFQLVDDYMPETAIRDTFGDITKWLITAAEQMREHSGITCFALRRDDQRMWATYGDNHSGVCLEFTGGSDGTSEIHKRAQPILYMSGALNEKLPELIQNDQTLDLHRLALWCYFVKSEDWREEREWRVFMLSVKPVPATQRYIAFKAGEVRRVFVGPRINASHRGALESLQEKQKWALLDIKPNVHTAISEFHGIDVLDGKRDYRYWFPEAFKDDDK